MNGVIMFLLGIFAGVPIGFFLAALLAAAKDHEE